MTPNLSSWCIEPLRETFLHGQPLVSAFVGLLTLLPSLRISDRQVLRSALTTALRLKKSSSILMFDA
ncbi:hypothetical protein E4U49_000927 [Claviceps purpurea]|nr:hypothetical protein E4U49_000927 [Claviceps purpurea]KAG6296772.1 hypothetical protein E4U45_005656 [Claviceps purpurea]